jgi:hypothetical protein
MTMQPGRSLRRRIGAQLVKGYAMATACGLLAACAGSTDADTKGLMLAGPNTNIVVNIPAGWHQVINSANPMIPEMVAPTTCMGSDEASCSLGLARVATITPKTIQDATHDVQQAVTSAPGVTDVAVLSEGASKVGRRDGYRQRFTFRNPGAALTSEIAAVPSGPRTPDAQGNLEYSVVLVWVSNRPDAPKINLIDDIVGSTLVHGGVPAP